MMRLQRGMTLIEVLVAVFLTATVLLACLAFMTTAFHATGHNLEKQFAAQKAISMLEELKSLVQVKGSSVSVLDAYDDGTGYKTTLTTDTAITNPDNPLSGNIGLGGSSWKYERQVTVSRLPGTMDDSVRLVNVKVCATRDDDADGKPDVLGEVAGVVRTASGPYPPTQVYDVYALAIENVPGWWVYMSNLIPFVQNAIQDLQSRNPGLEFRVHWITKLSYGRDMQYRPYINKTVDSNQPINWVYFYPGMLPTGQAVDYYYPPNNFKGHILVDSADANGYDAATNPNPYALADNYNNSMRYPDELALFNQRVASGQESDDSPTLRILLERMYQNPFAFRNAIFINLHGEMFPFPPVRNYSDAAKEPVGYPNIRAVTHSELLRYPNTASSVKLRVYSYRTDPDNVSAATNRDWLGQNTGAPVPITVTLKGVSWTPITGSSDIVAISGGTDQDGVAGADTYQAGPASNLPSTNGMYYTATSAGADTIISLYNSPLKSPQATAAGGFYAGLNSNERLYGLEYIPAPMENFAVGSSPPTPFGINLAAAHTSSGGVCTGGSCDKNTARWVITIPSSVLPGGANGNGLLTVETRIDSTTSGTRTDEPPNLSRTYVWKGTDAWIFGDGTAANLPHLPITEQYQFLGDPRHCPYADLKMPYQGSGLPAQNQLGMGFNRYFDDFENAGANKGATPGSNWQGFTYTVGGQRYGIKNDGTVSNDNWAAGTDQIEVDMHRVYQVLRTVMKSTRSVFTTMTGYSFYYVGLGNEIGYDSANGFAQSIPVSSKPFDGSNSTTNEQSILQAGCPAGVANGCGVKYIRSNDSGTYWWGLNWLGELYPDSAYSGPSGWATVGNLPTGSGSGTYRRTTRNSIAVNLPAGTTLTITSRRTQSQGCTSFFWTGTATSTFHHTPFNGTGNLQTDGLEVSNEYNYPLSSGIPINRPFNYNINNTSLNPDHFLQAPYGPVLTGSLAAQYYDHSAASGNMGSALLSFADTNNNVAFVVVNGISMTGQSGTSFIANWSMLSLIHSFFVSGLYNAANGYANHVEQVPRIVITSPDFSTDLANPATITVGWNRSWVRWDGQSYTSSYPGGYAETTALSYAVMYSTDNGATWKYMQDDTPATAGTRPASAAHLISTASNNPTYTWSTPASSFPQGTYIIRVECYRDTLPLHYSYHQYRAFIRR